jgi:Mrp family chromosome partitioning ATPase
MSAIDQAFIRAYQPDETPVVNAEASMAAPAPHFQGHRQVRRVSAPNRAPGVLMPGEAPAQRQPLSTFAQPGPTVESRFKPALEVDRFRWSAACDELIYRHAERLHPAVEALLTADDAGRSLIGLGAAAAGVGCTTVLACLARLLAEAGKSVAIVDGNFAAPGLAAQLGLAVKTGWENVLAGAVPLAESVIYSLADHVALLPLATGGATASEKLESIHASVTAGVLRYHYDLVLFDLGTVVDPLQGPIARRLARQCRLDGIVLVAGIGPTISLHPQRLLKTAPELAAICLGVVENHIRAA